MTDLKIAIVGAGPAGLTFARLLQLQKIKCTIFELESGINERNQGGTIDLHRQGGQLALRRAGLIEEFQKHSRPEGEASKIVKFDGTVLFDDNVTGIQRQDAETERPEIDRRKLRSLLLESLEPDTVVWSKKLQLVEKASDKPAMYDLHFADGVERGFSLVVGADGAWSKVRKYLTEQGPIYSGASLIELWALDVEQRHPWLSKYVGTGSVFMFDEDRMIICQRNGESSIRVYAGVRQPESWINDCGIDWSSFETAREQLIKSHFADCGEDLKRCIREASDELIPRHAWMLPVSMKWESKPGITLVGDAAHLMTPAAGVGVNLAMVDAIELAEAVVGSLGNEEGLEHAVRLYEEEMFPRAEKFARKTLHALEGHLSANGGEERVAMLKSR